MLTISNLSVQFGKRILFDEVNTTFTQGNCYGIIGANGAGKSTVLDTVLIGNKTLHAVKSEMDALYADYDDKNADRIGELQLQFDEMNCWNAESDAATLLSNLEIGAEHHYTLMGEMD